MIEEQDCNLENLQKQEEAIIGEVSSWRAGCEMNEIYTNVGLYIPQQATPTAIIK